MKVHIPYDIGFCAGVKNAVQTAYNLMDTPNVYCLGALVHNDVIMQKIAKKITVVDDVCKVPKGATLIIRAHGATKAIFDYCQDNGISIVDTTCKVVKNIQNIVKKHYEDGFQIVIFGEEKHPEVVGINGWCNNSAMVTNGQNKVDLSNYENVAVVFQSTFLESNVEKSLQNLVQDGVKSLVIFNTICYTTTRREKSAKDLAEKCDLTILIGDKKSSNTNKLFRVVNQVCSNVVWTDDGKIDEKIFLDKKNVCIISGTSAPQELIEEVLVRMENGAKEKVEVVSTENVADKNGALFAEAVAKIPEGKKYHVGQKVNCRVAAINDDGLTVTIPYWKSDATVPNEQIAIENWQECKKAIKVGDKLECSVISTDKGIVLSKKVIDERNKDDQFVESIKNGEQFTCKMIKSGKECLVGKIGSYTVIVHASQIKIGYCKDYEKYVGKELRLVSSADKVDDAKKLISASQKQILLAEKKAKEDEFWNNIEVDEIVEGKVLRFASFGAFISVRGFDCLAHSSDLSWTRIDSPAEVLEIGNTYEFVVLSLNREKNRVSLGYKQLQPQPLVLAAEKFAVGNVVTGKVARIMPFGAFVELDKNIDGLLHISNVSWDWIEDINTVLKVGDELEVQVVEFDGENKRITLSRRAVLPKPENAEKQEEQPQEEVVSE